MSVVSILGAKGGVGASLVATNLAMMLQGIDSAILVDLNLMSASDDLLLDLVPIRSWVDLLPVAGELDQRHIELAASIHERGLTFLAAPPAPPIASETERLPSLIRSLTRHFAWVVVDLEAAPGGLMRLGLAETDVLLVVLTPDPPALRGARRLCEMLPTEALSRAGLVINQVGRFQPTDVEAIARALGCQLMGWLPRAPHLVADQVNFGRSVITDHGSSYTQQMAQLATRLVSAGGRAEAVARASVACGGSMMPGAQVQLGPALTEIEERIHRNLADALEEDMQANPVAELPDRGQLTARSEALLDMEPAILTQAQRQAVVRGVVDRVVGLGPLEPLIEDPEITEIMVNGPGEVFVERRGMIEPAQVSFRDESQVRQLIDRIVAPIGRRIDESSPLVDARLEDGSRVNAIIPPLAIGGAALTIRKFSRTPFTLDRLVQLGTCSRSQARFLIECVRHRVSLIVSGGTGSGKTSALNALGLEIPEAERLITIEDAAELQLRHPNLVSLESRPPNIEGEGEIPIRSLVRNALRMRPDRIIVGEVRGGEAFDMLQAMNTGHRGSLTTLHANSPGDALVRLESMVLMAGFDMPLAAIRRMIGGAIEVVVQLDRLADGRRVMTHISALRRKGAEDLALSPIFTFHKGTGEFMRSHRDWPDNHSSMGADA